MRLGARRSRDRLLGAVADRVAATGVLLVGGASERFGSPKALAQFRGETLAARAWRALSDVCDEVIAVGKADDAHALPFPVVGDGSDEHAPVYGVMAGLRAARNDVCLVLPVDTPLVTPELLRELLAAGAVPQTGPLPGVYSKTMLGVLEARVAAGELSLRGVNPTVREVDEELLHNVNTRMELLAAAVADWARERDDVRGALDVGLFVDDPARLADDATWVEEFGRPVLTFLEPTAFGNRVERRVLYEGGQDVDFALLESSAWRQFASLPEARVTAKRGYRVLYDEVGIANALRELPAPTAPTPPDASARTELASDFWFHALWTAKKLRRGEVFTAISCLDGYLKERLVTLLEWHARAVDPSVDVWHHGRFLERWADPGALAALERAYAHYDLRDVARALWETVDLFQGLEEETARRLGFAIELDPADLRRRVSEIVRDPRAGRTLSP